MHAPYYNTGRQPRKQAPFEELRGIFKALDDQTLLERLQKTRWTGRPGYPIQVMWRTIVASFYLGIVHDTDLIRALHANPLLAATCGIRHRRDIPTKFAYCRFRKKLTAFNDLVGDVLARCVERLREALPGFGATVAVDATDVKAWANGLHQETDPDAGTGAKHKSSRRVYWYGYKVHLVADAESELPISFQVTAANVYDGAHLPSVLREAQTQYDWFQPARVLADKGYDSRECFRFVGEEMQAVPVIDVQGRRATAREGRPCEAEPVITPDGVHYRCQRVPYDPACPRFGKCPLLPMFADGPLNKAVPGRYFEQYSPFPYGSCQWKTIYNKRVSVERIFSRLKTYRKLDAIRTRRLPKVWLHVALSILAMNAMAAANAMGDQVSVRRCVA
jgi:IS5 family transposase